ncbi:allene oxide cyclase barrel-like domain-containing protein [Saccharothrix obliqua]|uniref:allene oxide cyclase barrel-like domain-containing protein n=1 Tax=Saccharothrix obliqua TaxID=2861747 RepID=UPI001C5EF92B|nr:hypothetical protein [Saccharothrix obliqua]MBW4717852.1 hypothetical protein [Saccharothrix obliqua]
MFPTTIGIPGRNLSLAAAVTAFTALAENGGLAPGGRCSPGDRDHAELVERVELDYRHVNPPGRSIGDWDTYDSELRTPDGDLVATLTGTGRILYQRSRDGHVMMYYRERLEFPDGTAQTAGWIDASEIIKGVAQRFPVVGTGGALSGTIGIRGFRPTPDNPHSRYESSLVLRSLPPGTTAPTSPEELDLLLTLLGALIGPQVNPEPESGRLEAPPVSTDLSSTTSAVRSHLA